MINGHFSKEFETKSGVRQGCCIAPFLFALTTESFCSLVDSDPKFHGLVIQNIRITLELFADDTCGYLGSNSDYQTINEHLNLHALASGAQLNISKSSIIFVEKEVNISDSINVISPEDIERLFGVFIGFGNCQQYDLNQILIKMEQKITKWSAVYLSQFGRSLVTNSSMLSHI
jgi:hypothetical protein